MKEGMMQEAANPDRLIQYDPSDLKPLVPSEPILSSTDVKQQHYVPQMFLKAFTGADGLLRVIDLDNGKEYKTSVRNAAVQGRFNDIEIGGEVLSTELWLSELEGAASTVLDKLISDPDCIISLSHYEEMTLARFIASLRFRTPQYRIMDDQMAETVATQIKELIKSQIFHQHSETEAQAIREGYEDQPAYKWLGESEPPQAARSSIFRLEEVQGWANLLGAAPWRIGATPSDFTLYTSDNPVAAYQRPVRERWEFGASFASFIYYVPISPNVLLKIERKPDGYEELRGVRRRLDFTAEEISVARHVVTRDATRFLFGDGIIVPRDCATDCLAMIGEAKLKFAIRYLNAIPPSDPQ